MKKIELTRETLFALSARLTTWPAAQRRLVLRRQAINYPSIGYRKVFCSKFKRSFSSRFFYTLNNLTHSQFKITSMKLLLTLTGLFISLNSVCFAQTLAGSPGP